MTEETKHFIIDWLWMILIATFLVGLFIGNVTSDRVGDPKFDTKLQECLDQLQRERSRR